MHSQCIEFCNALQNALKQAMNFNFIFRRHHEEIEVKTSKDAMDLCIEESKVKVDPTWPLIMNQWLEDALTDFFRSVLKLFRWPDKSVES